MEIAYILIPFIIFCTGLAVIEMLAIFVVLTRPRWGKERELHKRHEAPVSTRNQKVRSRRFSTRPHLK